MKIQISNFYNLSIILFILSGCQELRDLNIGDQILLEFIKTKETKIETERTKIEAERTKNGAERTKNEAERTIIETKENTIKTERTKNETKRTTIETEKNTIQDLETSSKKPEKKHNSEINYNLVVGYSNLSRLKAKIGSLIYFQFDSYNKKAKNLFSYNFRKPKFKVDFDISKTLYILALQKKHLYYNNSFLELLISDNFVLLNSKILNSIRYSELINLLSDPDYIRRQSQILTLQYRLNECVVDFYFNANDEALILYDMRESRYDGSFFEENCMLGLNLRLIYNS